ERVRLRLATARSRALARLAAVYRSAVALQRCRLDPGVGRKGRLGDLSLRTLGAAASRRLGVGARRRMGIDEGLLAHANGILALAAGSRAVSVGSGAQCGDAGEN